MTDKLMDHMLPTTKAINNKSLQSGYTYKRTSLEG